MLKTIVSLFSIRRGLWLATVVILTLFVTRVYLHQGLPYTHDGDNHVARFANYMMAVREGQLPPRFAPNLVNRYGYPVFNYNYPLANIMSVPFSIVDVPYTITFKWLMMFFVAVGVTGMGVWLARLNFTFSSQLQGMALFALSPYLFNTILYRGNIGEVMAMAILPWVFVAIELLRSTKTPLSGGRLLLWLALVLLFLAHNVTVIFAVPLLITYAGVRFNGSLRLWLELGLGLVVSTLLTLWFWLPAIAEKSAVILDKTPLSTEFVLHFPTWHQLLFSPSAFGFSYPGTLDSLSFSLGLVQWLGLVLTLLLLLKYRQRTPTLWWLVIISTGLILIQSKQLLPVWEMMPIVRFIQFPWRLSLFLVLFLAVLGAWVFAHIKGFARGLFITCLMLQALYFSRLEPVRYTYFLDREYENFSESTTTLNENTPLAFKYLMIGDWQPTPTLAEGEGSIKVGYWFGSKRAYNLVLTQPSLVVEPTMLFAGWQTRITPRSTGGNTYTAIYEDSEVIKGRLAYRLPAGEYAIDSHFTQQTTPRLIGNTVSMITAVLVTVYVGWLSLQWTRGFVQKKYGYEVP